MKKTLISIESALFIFSLAASAHGPMNFGDVPQTQQGMMGYMEERAMGAERHEEMEELMMKMIAGNLEEGEASRMTDLMNQYAGAGGMMMMRMIGMGPWMMQGAWGAGVSFWAQLLGIGIIVWLAVGILLAVWLWKQIKKI